VVTPVRTAAEPSPRRAHGLASVLAAEAQSLSERLRPSGKFRPRVRRTIKLTPAQHGNNCCTANHSQGFPKFVASAFLTADRGRALVQVYLGPVRVHTTLAGDNAVAVTVETNYPLADTVRVAVNAHAAYTHYVRVPEWAKRSGLCTIVVDGGTPRPLAPNADSLCAVRVPAGTTTFVLELPANIELTHGVSGGVHVNRGPLLFAGDITRVENILDAHEVGPRALSARTAGIELADRAPRATQTRSTSRWSRTLTSGSQSIQRRSRTIIRCRASSRTQYSRAAGRQTLLLQSGAASTGHLTATRRRIHQPTQSPVRANALSGGAGRMPLRSCVLPSSRHSRRGGEHGRCPAPITAHVSPRFPPGEWSSMTLATPLACRV
jgi:hypothetical protein